MFLVKFPVELARRLKLDQVIWVSLDDSLCEKDSATEQLETVNWHHDHNARGKQQASYKKGSVYVLFDRWFLEYLSFFCSSLFGQLLLISIGWLGGGRWGARSWPRPKRQQNPDLTLAAIWRMALLTFGLFTYRIVTNWT